MNSETLYNLGIIVADTRDESERECEIRILTAIGSLKDVFNAERVPHMVAMDKVGEVTFNLFIHQDADLDALAEKVSAIVGIKYADLSPDLVRLPEPR